MKINPFIEHNPIDNECHNNDAMAYGIPIEPKASADEQGENKLLSNPSAPISSSNTTTDVVLNPVAGMLLGNVSTAIRSTKLPIQLQNHLISTSISEGFKNQLDVYRHQAYTNDAMVAETNRAKTNLMIKGFDHENKLSERSLTHQQQMELEEMKHEHSLAEIDKKIKVSIPKEYDKDDIDVKVYEDADNNLVARIIFNATGQKRERFLFEGVMIRVKKLVCKEERVFPTLYELTFERKSNISRMVFQAEDFTGPNIIRRLKEASVGFSFPKRYKEMIGNALKDYFLRHCELVTLHAYNGWNICLDGVVFIPFGADSMYRRLSNLE